MLQMGNTIQLVANSENVGAEMNGTHGTIWLKSSEKYVRCNLRNVSLFRIESS